jgi:hypothetical protein
MFYSIQILLLYSVVMLLVVALFESSSVRCDNLPGVWTVAHDDSGTAAHVRNLYWEGYGFYNVLGTPEYGSVYFGIGVPNYDIAFML